MAQYNREGYSTDGPISGATLDIALGPHGRDNIDPSTGLWLVSSGKVRGHYHAAQEVGVNAANKTLRLGEVRGDGTIQKIKAGTSDRPSADRTCAIKLQRYRAGSISDISSTYTINSSTPATDNTSADLTISDAALEAGDILLANFAVGGSSGDHAQGVSLEVWTDENPDP